MSLKNKFAILIIAFSLLACGIKFGICPANWFWQSLKVFTIAFLLNLIYELSHSRLYDWKKPPLNPEFKFYLKTILNSTLGDALFITSFIWVVSLIKRSTVWLISPVIMDYAIIILLGVAAAVIMETHARNSGRWYYSKYMPQVFKVGITPLVQLALTGVLALKILGYL